MYTVEPIIASMFMRYGALKAGKGRERPIMEGLLYLEDGQAFKGKGFGAAATIVGELVFNTAMTGYQELLTDPSSKGLVINMTYPLIGNYGVSDVDDESGRIHAFGLVARDITFRPSNRCSVKSVSEWLKGHEVPGVYNVDTRAITKIIRTSGAMKCLISTEGISRGYAQELLERAKLRSDFMRDAGVELRLTRPGSAAEGAPGRGLRIAVLDFGVRKSLVAGLTGRGCDVVLCPYGTTAEEILAMKADGLLLSDGPGDPSENILGARTAADLIGRLPILGAGLGHLTLALAAGGNVYKLKHGHHGANYGVKDLDTGRSVITSQGHSYAVDAESLRGAGMAVTHVNLNDGSVEGMRHERQPVFSVQFHPEGPPGPSDANGVIDRFVRTALAVKAGDWKPGGEAGRPERKEGGLNA